MSWMFGSGLAPLDISFEIEKGETIGINFIKINYLCREDIQNFDYGSAQNRDFKSESEGYLAAVG